MIVPNCAKKREALKLTQPELAEAIGLSQQRICEWETKDSNVKLEHVMKMCEVLQIDVNEISKDATTINILNNNHQSKDQSNPVVGNNINIENNLHHELITTLKNQNENLTKHLENQKQIIDNYDKHSNFLEEIIVWFKNKAK